MLGWGQSKFPLLRIVRTLHGSSPSNSKTLKGWGLSFLKGVQEMNECN